MSKRLYIHLFEVESGDSLTLPINPESIDIRTEKEVEIHKILNYGEVPVSGYNKLTQITLSSLLPADDTLFAVLASLIKTQNSRKYTQEETIGLIENWVELGRPIRVIIAGDIGDDINLEFLATSFNKTVREYTPDVMGTLELTEYRNPERAQDNRLSLAGFFKKIKKIGNTAINTVKIKARPVKKFIPSYITAKKGDTLYKIAKRVYDEADTKSKELAKINGIFDRNEEIAGKRIEMVPIDKTKGDL